MQIILHKNDLDPQVTFKGSVAVDTETLGLNIKRDPLCLVQLSGGDGVCHLVHLDRKTYKAPHLVKILNNPRIQKIFHYARFDVAVLRHYLSVDIQNIYCTKIASKLARTYTDRHGLKDLCASILDVELSKEIRTSDWSAKVLSEAQHHYAASDVLYLHNLREKLDEMLQSMGRQALAKSCFDFIPTIVQLDLEGWDAPQIFAHR